MTLLVPIEVHVVTNKLEDDTVATLTVKEKNG